MKKILFSMLFVCVYIFNIDAEGVLNEQVANDTLVKLNFSFEGWDVAGWTNVIGSGAFPVALDNGITIEVSGGNLAGGSSGEPTSSVVPDSVSNTYNWVDTWDATPIDFTIMGLDTEKTYNFQIFASRDDETASGDRTTTFGMLGSTETVSVYTVGNQDTLLTISDVEPAATGAVVLRMTKNTDAYGYINALIVTEASSGVTYNFNTSVTGNGTIGLSPETGPYEEGTEVTLTATAETGWEFVEWTGDVSGSNATISVVMDGEKTVSAIFVEADPVDTLVKLNFSFDGWDVAGWTNVLGSGAFPIAFDNGITIEVNGGSLAAGSSGEPESSVVPDSVSNTYNWLDTGDDTPVDFTFLGLDPEKLYSFHIFASRDDETASGDRTTSFSILGSTESVSVYTIGNQDTLLTISDVQPAATGGIVMQMTKLTGAYGYINALILTTPDISNSIDEFDASQISYFPVPANDFMELNNLPQKSVISLFDISGRKVIEQENIFNSHARVDLSELRKGIYIFQISNTNTTLKTFKIIKK